MACLRGLWAFYGQLFAKESFGVLLNVSKMIPPWGDNECIYRGRGYPSELQKYKGVLTP